MTILDSNCKMDPVTRFKKMLDNTGQNSDGLLFERDHSVRDGGDGDWIHAAHKRDDRNHTYVFQ
jgi:hypothetical protein